MNRILRTVSNPEAITNTDPDPKIIWLYPRWTRDERGVVCHCSKTRKNQLYIYGLKDGSTVRLQFEQGRKETDEEMIIASLRRSDAAVRLAKAQAGPAEPAGDRVGGHAARRSCTSRRTPATM